MRTIIRGATSSQRGARAGSRGARTVNVVGKRPPPRATALAGLHYGQLAVAAVYALATAFVPSVKIDGAAALAGAYALCVLSCLRNKLLYAQLMTLCTSTAIAVWCTVDVR